MFSLDIRSAVHPDAVPEFTSQHLIHRYPICFSRQVPEGKLYAAYSAALSGRASELFNPAEQLINIAGILAYKTAFKCQHIIAGPAVPDFSIAHQSLVCINLYQGTMHGSPYNISYPYVRNL